ncbi:MAG: GGDEF domain-containing protein [Lysobacteraceae bacterium]|nr:MAG: GGDEF domain-containing protein [Xanthomonadaceae bacterium]
MDQDTGKARLLGDSTVRVAAPSLRAEARPWCLVVVAGPAIGTRYELGDAAIIGRDPGADIQLAEPSVSRRHCHVFRKRGSYWVTDLGATNPTRVNGLQIKASPLLEGDVLTIGDLVLKLLGPNSPENAVVAALHRQATRDGLTGLANRRCFRAEMERVMAAAGEAGPSLVLLDIDHFKHINDRFGHPAGDRVLSTVGGVLAQCVAPPALAGRVGGEEFAVLLPDAGSKAALELAETLRQALEALCLDEDGEPLPVTASFGVAERAQAEESVDALYLRADTALYEAKRGGRNRVVLGAA